MAYASVFPAGLQPAAAVPVRRRRIAWVSWISIAMAVGLARAYAAPVEAAAAPEVTLPELSVVRAATPQNPASQGPISQGPISQGPISPVPAAKAPATPAPIPAVAMPTAEAQPARPLPVAAVSIPQAPAGQDAVAQAPISSVSVAPVPVTQMPVTQVPATQAPARGAAIAQASAAPDVTPTPVPVQLVEPAPVSVSPPAATPALPPIPLVKPMPPSRPAAPPAPPLPTVTTTAPARPTAVAATPLSMEAGTGKIIALTGAAANVFVADPKVAEVRPASATSLFVFGINAGRTTIAALDADGHTLVQYDLTVEPQAYAASQAQAMIRRLLPSASIQVHAQTRGLLLTGSVNTPQDAAQAVSIAKGFGGDNLNIDNELSISAPMQVTLNVRIAQMSRTVVRNMGINWSSVGSVGRIGTLPALALNANSSTVSCGPAQGSYVPICPGVNFNGVIDALAQDNLAHVLAEPNLTVKSGQPASFQVGGEYPIPVSAQNGSISVAYKEYGIMLSFLPTVLSDGRIDIHVKPEVSELDKSNGVTVSSGTAQLVIPAITVRRAESSVELGSGESFAIAGLLQQQTTDNAQSIPGVGETPLIGALFRDTAFQKQDIELVIVVTPYIVRPVSNPNQLHLPTDNYRTPSDIDRLLFMRQVAANEPPVPVKIPGSAGFIVQ